jgi:hypothetical protein
MRCYRFLLVFVGIVTLAVGLNTAAPPHSPAASAAAPRSWTADNGNGTYSNPLFYEEFEDPDVIRVGEDYYLAGTTVLMSLTNHRYLATKPNNPGPVTVSATGPRPDRKDGACFKWKAVE